MVKRVSHWSACSLLNAGYLIIYKLYKYTWFCSDMLYVYSALQMLNEFQGSIFSNSYCQIYFEQNFEPMENRIYNEFLLTSICIELIQH